MPNWVSNTINVTGDDANLVIQSMLTDDEVDFEKIVPRPDELKHTSSPQEVKDYSEEEYQKALKEAIENPVHKDFISYPPLTRERSERYTKEYGANNWYDWSFNNWGTKWNVNGSYLEGDTVQFDTAWSCPMPIVQALSTRFPKNPIHIQWADEDMGYNVGQATLVNGEVVSENIPEGGSKEAYEIYFNENGNEDEYRYNEETGEYEYIED
jgi:hypothetical protein